MKIIHFSDKAWLITWERQGGGFGCRQYGISGIYNKPKLAQIALDELNEKSKNDSRIEYKIKEVSIDKDEQLFEYYY